jgi:predicted phage gp36 major capsid-like protein
MESTKTAVAGNFKIGFRIIDRIGMAVEQIPFLFGAAQGNLPVGQRGLYMWWRVGSTCIGAASAAGCPLRYLEIK